MISRDEAAAELRASRAALLGTASEFRLRLSAQQLAEDAVRLIDPKLSFLGRLSSGVRSNPLLSLAVLAGVGWLAGMPRRRTGVPQRSRAAETAAMRTTVKEKKNDSGHGPGSGNGDGKHLKEKAGALEQAEIRLGRNGEADAHDGRVAPPGKRSGRQPQWRGGRPEERPRQP